MKLSAKNAATFQTALENCFLDPKDRHEGYDRVKVSDGNFENQVFEMFSGMFALVKEITGEKEMTMFEFLHILNQSYFLFQKEGRENADDE